MSKTKVIVDAKVSFLSGKDINCVQFFAHVLYFFRAYQRSVPWYFEWLSNLSWFRYGNEALLINQWENVDYISCSRSNTTCPRDGHVVLETYNFDEGNYLKDYLCLFGLIMGFRTLAYLALLLRTYTKRGT